MCLKEGTQVAAQTCQRGQRSTAFLGSWLGPKMSTIDLICLISVALSKRIRLPPLVRR